jgi:hypothetical protein
MISPKTTAEIDSLASNHRRNTSLPIRTNAAFIKLAQLEQFISQVRTSHPSADTFQINIIRYPLPANTPDLEVAGNNLSQVSLMFIPVRTINASSWSVQTVVDQNNQALSLSINDPNSPTHVDNGLCPPKGSCLG